MKYHFGQKVYYKSEITDEIVNFNLLPQKIDGNYKYLHKNIFYKLCAFVMYFFVAKITVWLYIKFKRIKIVNQKILKQQKGGYFIYANHTNQLVDSFHPSYTCGLTKKPHIICNSSNLSIPFIAPFVSMWGALPLPDTIEATKHFTNAIKKIINKQPILIYPEAHLWPFYTKIRPFSDKSFKYPAQFNKPIYTFTTTYQLKKMGKPPKVVIYVDGPFYPNITLPITERKAELHDRAYSIMVERSKNSNYDYLTYIKINGVNND